MSKFRITGDSKILDTLQNSMLRKNSASITILPTLKATILDQNYRALGVLEFQAKGLQQEYNQLISKK